MYTRKPNVETPALKKMAIKKNFRYEDRMNNKKPVKDERQEEARV